MFRCLLRTIAVAMRPKTLLFADNLCLRQQLFILKRRQPRPLEGYGPAFVDSAMPVVRRLTKLCAYYETPNHAALPNREDWRTVTRDCPTTRIKFRPERSPSICNRMAVAGARQLGGRS
jgi:hypothetical protein